MRLFIHFLAVPVTPTALIISPHLFSSCCLFLLSGSSKEMLDHKVKTRFKTEAKLDAYLWITSIHLTIISHTYFPLVLISGQSQTSQSPSLRGCWEILNPIGGFLAEWTWLMFESIVNLEVLVGLIGNMIVLSALSMTQIKFVRVRNEYCSSSLW